MNETKIDKLILDNLKRYKGKENSLDNLSHLFATYYIGCLHSLTVRFSFGGIVVLRTPLELRQAFIDKMSDIIKKNEYDYLDNVALEIINSLHFMTRFGNINIDINDREKQKFINICNSFKGKNWNDIIHSFVDATYDLLCGCTIQGGQLLLGARMWL